MKEIQRRNRQAYMYRGKIIFARSKDEALRGLKLAPNSLNYKLVTKIKRV